MKKVKVEEVLTSVKVDPLQFEEFKINSVKYKYSLHKLTNRSIYLFNTNIEFRKLILNTKLPKQDNENTQPNIEG